jgi:hypothetical protein
LTNRAIIANKDAIIGIIIERLNKGIVHNKKLIMLFLDIF